MKRARRTIRNLVMLVLGFLGGVTWIYYEVQVKGPKQRRASTYRKDYTAYNERGE